MSVAVVTGAAGGLGRAMVRRLAEDGPVLAVDLSEAVEDVAAGLVDEGFDVRAVRADLTEPDGIAAVVLDVDRVRLLVNNAGITRDARLVKMERPQFDAVLAVNLGAVFELTSALVPSMEDGGSVVSISSRAYLGNFGQFNYAMSKGGVVGLTRALSLQLAPRIRANAIAPGLIETPMAQAIPDEILERMIGAIPMGRMGTPDDIAEAVAWLGDGERSGYVTGHVLVVGGGRSLSR